MNRASHLPQPSGKPNVCPACQQHIGVQGLKARAKVQNPKAPRARVQRQCPHCATPLRPIQRGWRPQQLALAAGAWLCWTIAGVKGFSATSALAWLGYLGVCGALALQVLAPRWYARDV